MLVLFALLSIAQATEGPGRAHGPSLPQHVDMRPDVVRAYVGEEAWAKETCWVANVGPEAPDQWWLRPGDPGVTLTPCPEGENVEQ